MAVFEIQVVTRSGEIEPRYTDRAVNIGDQLKIDARNLVVLRRVPSPTNPLASAAFLCAEPTGPVGERPTRPAARQAA